MIRYHEIIGYIDDTFAKYRKEECTPDSKWSPYAFYKNLDDVKVGYSVYCGAVKQELKELIEQYQQDQQIKFTDEEMSKLFSEFETANNQDNDDDAWTDIMFRDKFWFMDTFREILANYKVAG